MKHRIITAILPLCLTALAAAAAPREILMVVTSHDRIDEEHPTGLWLEEFAVPYEIFIDAGHRVKVTSTRGGAAPIDPRSLGGRDAFRPATLAALEDTAPLSSVDPASFDAVFFPGGHGTMYDLPEHEAVRAAVEHFVSADLPAAFVCHGPAALVGARLADGTPVVQGRRITGFTNSEERAVELDDDMPFLLETRLGELGGAFVGAADFTPHVIVDGRLVTGQNPASSEGAARELLKLLE